MKTSKQLINELKDSGAITEDGRLILLVAIERERLEIEERFLGDIKETFNKIIGSLNG